MAGSGLGATVVDEELRPVKHHPQIASTSRYGCWGACMCGGWASRTWTTVSGVHLEFGEHLLDAAGRTPRAEK